MSRSVSKLEEVISELSRYIVGYGDLLKLMAVAVVSRGHVLIEGPPGTGKTTVAKLFAQAIGGTFRRVQMTPDLLPSDIIGTFYYDMARGEWRFRQGPIFANVLFVDELNRAPPRTQAALIEAMQEGQVTVEGRTFELPRPFLVIATQMPVGSEGTYPLTPVLADRFAYSYTTSLPSAEEEIEILDRVDAIDAARVEPMIGLDQLLEMQRLAREVYVSPKIKSYIVSLVKFVREQEEVALGPSPRASIWLMKGSRALALMEGSDFVVPDHVKWLARYVLPQRIVLKPEASVAGVSATEIVERALESVEVPKA